jgi:hypothetical protein
MADMVPVSDRPVCSLCHTASADLTLAELAAGGAWRCRTCGQHWDARRVDTVAASAVWAQANPAHPHGWILDIHASTPRAATVPPHRPS